MLKRKVDESSCDDYLDGKSIKRPKKLIQKSIHLIIDNPSEFYQMDKICDHIKSMSKGIKNMLVIAHDYDVRSSIIFDLESDSQLEFITLFDKPIYVPEVGNVKIYVHGTNILSSILEEITPLTDSLIDHLIPEDLVSKYNKETVDEFKRIMKSIMVNFVQYLIESSLDHEFNISVFLYKFYISATENIQKEFRRIVCEDLDDYKTNDPQLKELFDCVKETLKES